MSDRGAMRPMRAVARISAVAMLLLIAGTLAGCGTIRVTDTPRSATEQLLLSQSWDNAVAAVDFSPIVGPPVFLDDALLSGPDKGWMVYRIRESMARQGVSLVDDRSEAVCVVEVAAGVFGTDSATCLIGMPSNGLVTAAAGAQGMVLPEMALAKKTEQYGVTRLAMFARDLPTGTIVWESGTIDADAVLKNGSVLGIPMRSGTIEHPADRRKNETMHRVLGGFQPRRHHAPADPVQLPQ